MQFKAMKFSWLGVIPGLALLAATTTTAQAEPEVHGFVEAGYGAQVDPPEGSDFTLQELRTQLQFADYSDKGEFFASIDVLHDQVLPGNEVSLGVREAWLKFLAFDDRLEVKAGRQALNWGTGDLLFANDLFGKDWNSFFIGRKDPYLKVPTDAFRVNLRRLPVGVDLVYIPRFTADILPDPMRLPMEFPVPPGMIFAGVEEPRGEFGDGEVALRLYRRLGAGTASLYAYKGYTSTPEAARVDSSGTLMTAYHPELRAYGASMRGSLAGGVYWAEGVYRDIPDNRDGADPMLPVERADLIVGYERSFGEAASWELQYYGAFELEDRPGLEATDRHLVTLRLEKRWLDETLHLSLFAFHSPDDEDGHVRPYLAYDYTDEIQLTVGANVFYGDPGTLFGDLDEGDNLYARMRYSF